MPYYLEVDLVEGQETDNKELVEDNKELVEGNKERCIGTVNKKEKLYDLFVKSVGENPDCQKVYDDIKKRDGKPSEWCIINEGDGGGCKFESSNQIGDTGDTGELNTTEILNKLRIQLSDSFAKTLMEQIKKINEKTSNKLYDESESARYIMNINKMSLIDFGDPKYSDELDFMENVMINFIDLPDNKMGDLFNCSEDLNVNILLTLAIFYNRNRSGFDNIRDNNLVKVDRILNRLGRYLPDVFQKILTGMKMCDPKSTKYVVLEQIYKTMFKFNNTTVNLGLMDGITSIFQNLKGMRTIEMIVMIMAIAFVVSKIFDMFRVKVEV